ncbi:DUF1064 domain-containing protein [Paenirhodobacter populi]|uniref:DUF1064 domain-containing protein n=1 Tax=Paenirhodobacter populi TaxID=2306993 RepID=A0A443J7G8_9RHOB|nr:DUF1064 domain-containing protein [Sinirhodobacter populi]RWR16413.1 DUF1064 domain-containing protein [Sinirhodobacter populi]
MTERMTAAQLRAGQEAQARAKNPKYGNKRVKTEDGDFDSQREAGRWESLKLLQRAGQITDLKRQVKIPLMGRDGPLLTETGRQRFYVADFTYFDVALGIPVVEDSKGARTKEYLLKKSVCAAQGITVKET